MIMNLIVCIIYLHGNTMLVYMLDHECDQKMNMIVNWITQYKYCMPLNYNTVMKDQKGCMILDK